MTRLLLLAMLMCTPLCMMKSSASAQQMCPHWEQVAISARRYHAMAYDSNRNVTVVFGGLVQALPSQFLGDTWEYDHAAGAWSLRSTTGPSPRCDVAMAFDSARKVVVLFGGQNDDKNEHYADTWEWNGTTWSLRAPSGPSNWNYQMAYDSARQVCVMLGPGETWDWDGTNWALRSTTGPSSLVHFGITFDSSRQVTVVFGGYSYDSPAGPRGNTWEWDGNSWTEIDVAGPSARYRLAMTFDSIRGVVVLHGGAAEGSSNPTAFQETWEYDGKQWTHKSKNGPPRVEAAMSFDVQQGRSILFGGRMTHGDSWAWDGTEWNRINDAPHTYSSYSSAVYDINRNATILFNSYFGMTRWAWNGSHWTQTPISGASPPFAPMAYDSKRDVIVMFGGGGTQLSSDTWEFDGSQWTLRSITGPSPRVGHHMVYDDARGTVMLFGGRGSSNAGLSDTWEWNGVSGMWTELFPVTSPPPRHSHGMAYDIDRDRIVLTGGGHNSTRYQDTWEWDGRTWYFMGTDSTIISYVRLVYDSTRKNTIRAIATIGGAGNFQLHQWDGNTWSVLLPNGPYPYSGIRTMAYDIARGVIVALTYGAQTLEVHTAPGSPGDVTCDLVVNISDILAIINDWGPCVEPCPPSCHLDIAPPGGDCQIGVPDLLAVINNWGP